MVCATVHAADAASRENLDARQACERESGGDSRGAVHATRHGDAQIPTADFSNALSAKKPLQIIAFQSENWLPIDLRIEDNFPRSVAAYKQFDVLFVNAIFDGLNLVAKEAPLVNTQDGSVVLSENAGAYEEIGSWTLTINPFDVAAQAEALHEALEMRVDERRGRLDAIRAHVREHDLARWLASQLEELDRASARVS